MPCNLAREVTATSRDLYNAEAEYRRMGVQAAGCERHCSDHPTHTVAAKFRLSRVNQFYGLCPSYPAVLAVPATVTDGEWVDSVCQEALTVSQPVEGEAIPQQGAHPCGLLERPELANGVAALQPTPSGYHGTAQRAG